MTKPSPPPSLTLRDVTPDDLDAVNALHDAMWFPARSRQGWNWLMTGNPDQGGLSPGKIAEHPENGIVGFIGNHGVRFFGRDAEFSAATGYSMLAKPEFPGVGVRLLGSLLRQKTGFGLFTLNNNKLAEKVYPRFRGEPLFPQTASLQLQWVTNPLLYVAGGMRRRIHAMRGYATSRHHERFSLSARAPVDTPGATPHVRQIDIDQLAASGIDAFWTRLSGDGRIHANRNLASLTWRLSNPDQAHSPIVLGFDRGDGIEGLLIAMLTKESEIAPPALTIMDLTAIASSEAEALPALVRSALGIARARKLAKTVLPYLNPHALTALQDLAAPRFRQFGHVHAHVKFGQDAPRELLTAHWAPTPWDGDFSFCVRQPPVRSQAERRINAGQPRS